MNTAAPVILFDVNETLSDMSPMADRFSDLGAPPHLAKLWFATLLRDGFALTAVGASRPFAEVGADALRTLLHGVELRCDLDEAVERVTSAVGRLPLHPDVVEGLRALRAAGYRLATLTNGSTQVCEQLFGAAGIRGEFEALLSVQEAGAWKPAPAAYDYAVRACGVAPQEVLLVAVHPWDVDGAARAGLRTAWIDRTGSPYPSAFTAPSLRASDLVDLSAQLG